METPNTQNPASVQLTLTPLELITLNKWMKYQEDKLETLQEDHEDLQKRFDDLTRMYESQNQTITMQSNRLKKLTDENCRLAELQSMAEGIFMGTRNESELGYLTNLYHARMEGVYVPKVKQIITGDYSMEKTNPS